MELYLLHIQESFMKRKFLYTCLFLLLAVIGHSYVIYRFIHDGVLFTGPNDGM